MKKKSIALLMAVVMLFGVVGATLAWLQDTTDEVTNTFTVGNINIELEETWNTDTDDDGENDSWEAKLVPGTIRQKDPKVTVEAGSEKCYLFVTIEELNNSVTAEIDGVEDTKTIVLYKEYLTNTDNNPIWIKLELDQAIANTEVYYTIVDVSADGSSDFVDYILTSGNVNVAGEDGIKGAVTINPELKKEHIDVLDGLAEGKLPSLTFQAYAVQYDNMTDVNEAWTVAITGAKD